MWIKKLRKRKLQSILIVLIIMVSSMLMTSAIVIMTSWEKPYEELIKECASPVLKLYLYGSNTADIEGIIERFETLDQVEEAVSVPYSFLRQKVKHNNQPMDYFLDLVTYDDRLHEQIRIIQGERKISEVTGCMIPAVLAFNENIEIGDIIEIGEGNNYTVEGIYADPYNMSVSFDVEIIVRQIPEQFEVKSYISVYSKSKMKGEDLIDLYRENNQTLLEGRGVALENRISNNQMTEQILGGILLAMSVMVLMVSGIMIRYMIKSCLIEERKSVAIYKVIGYENKYIIGLYLKFYLFFVGIGSVLGAGSSKIISDSFTKLTFRNLGIQQSSGIYVSGIICISAIIAYVSLQVILVLKNINKIKPIEVFRGKERINGSVRKAKIKILSNSPFSMAIRMVVREKKNTIIILFTCIMSAYCLNFATTAFTLMKGMGDNNYYWIGFDEHDVAVESMDLTNFNMGIRKLRTVKEVDRVIETTTDISPSLEWSKGVGDTMISAMVYETYEDINMPVLEGRNPRYSNEIAIGGAIANKLNKKVGDYLDIYLNGNQRLSLLICGTFQSFYNMGKSSRMLGETLTENGIEYKYTEASVYLKEGAVVEDFLTEYQEEFAGTFKLLDRKDRYENIMNMINGPQMMAIKPFMILALLLGGLNIIAIVYLKNKDNSKTNSIYKAIGYSANHMLCTNMIYILILAITSIVITIPLFIILFPKIMVLSMSLFGFKEYLVTYDIKILILSNLGTLIIYMISGLLSSVGLYENPIKDLTCD